jgi:voltage-gated potassium channel
MKNSVLWVILYKMRIPFLVILISYSISIIGLLLIDGIDADGKPYSMTIFDAFYFVTYTATTIGFGETPYDFTYSQRLWVSAMIYLSVISWFYAVGTLVSLLQDKLFLTQIAQNKFGRQVLNLRESFIIILGYNYTTSEIIKIINGSQTRIVVIESDQAKIDNLFLENYTPIIPILKANSYDAYTLEFAGIKSMYCKAVVSLYKNDDLNLRIALTSKMLNPNIIVAAKSTTLNHTENLKDLNVEIVENPFKIIASHINLALTAPNLLKIEKWIYQIGLLNDSLPALPRGKYIVSGFGRMGQEINKVFSNNNIECEFIDIDYQKINQIDTNYYNNKINFIHGNSDDRSILNKVNIQNAVAIIAGTNDDTTNISILKTAKKLNPNIITIARENNIEDFSIFENAKIDYIFVPSKILINKTTNALTKPSADKFIKYLTKKDEAWGQSLIKRLIQTIDENPKLHVLHLTINKAPALITEMKLNNIKLEVFSKSLSNRKILNNIVPLMIYNSKDKKETILPSWNEILKEEDKILFACDSYAIDEIEYIAQNLYELHYVLTGEEKSNIKLKW